MVQTLESGQKDELAARLAGEAKGSAREATHKKQDPE
jgi:hypothetical protein